MTAIEFNNHIVMLQSKLKSFAYTLTANREDAQDLVQDTVVKAISYRDKFADQTNLAAWLYTIMKNTFINNYRRKKKGNTIIDGSKELENLRVINSDGYGSPESKFRYDELSKGIEALPKELKHPFVQHMNGYKYKEIAQEMKLPIGTVKSRIFLARQELMSKFIGYNNQ